MKSVNLLSVDRIYKVNANPLNDKVKGSVLEHFTKDVYYSYEDIEINELKRLPEENAWLVNGKYKIAPEPKRGTDITDVYFANEKEVIAAVVGLNEVEYNKQTARVKEAQQMADFLYEAISADAAAAEKLK